MISSKGPAYLAGHADNVTQPPPTPSWRWSSPWTSTSASPGQRARPPPQQAPSPAAKDRGHLPPSRQGQTGGDTATTGHVSQPGPEFTPLPEVKWHIQRHGLPLHPRQSRSRRRHTSGHPAQDTAVCRREVAGGLCRMVEQQAGDRQRRVQDRPSNVVQVAALAHHRHHGHWPHHG